MKRILLAFAVFVCSLPAFSQGVLPGELAGNWFLSGNNAWKYGFYEEFAMVDGVFWDYSELHVKRKHTVLHLKNGKARRELVISSVGEGKLEVRDSLGRVAVFRERTENPDYGSYETDGFRQPVVAPAAFHLSGVIDGYDPQKDNYKFARIIYNHLLEDDQVVHLVQLDSLGRFSLEFPLMNPQGIMFKFGNRLIGFYAVPGSSLMMSVNKTSLARLFAGPEGLLNSEIEGYKRRLHEIIDFESNHEQVGKLDQHDYKKFRLGKMNEQLDDLKTYSTRHGSSARFTQQTEAYIRYSAADDLMRYRWLHGPERVVLSDEYMDFTAATPLNNDLGPLTQLYNSFLDEYLSFMIATRENSSQRFTLSDMIIRARADGAQIDPGEEETIRRYDELYSSDTSAARKFFENDSAGIRGVLEKYRKAIQEAAEYLAVTGRNDALANTISSLSEGLGKDVLLGRIAVGLIGESERPLEESRLKFYRERIGTDGIYQQIVQHSQDLALRLAGSAPAGARMLPALKAAQDSVFEALVSGYKGKVVYIDFWAPWCGPCMGEMPASKILREEMQGEDVVFLYLGVNCSEDSWAKTIKLEEIEGEHYLLSPDEYALLSSRFRISGIPRYILVDREGRLHDEDADRPSSGGALLDIRSLLE